MQTIPFPTGKDTAFLLLVGTGEIKLRKIGTGIDLFAADADKIVPARNHLINRFLRIDILVRLVGITDTDGLAHLERPFVDTL